MKTLAWLLISFCAFAQPARKAPPKRATAAQETPKYRWDIQKSGVSDELLGVYFADTKTGWAVGQASALLKTTDGGDTWKRLMDRDGGQNFFHVVFRDRNNGWLEGTSNLLYSNDGGQSWQPASSIPGAGFGHGVPYENSWYLVTTIGVFRTDDHGATWKKLGEAPRNDYDAIAVIDPQHLWIAGLHGRVASSSDGGATWSERMLPFDTSLSKIRFVTPQLGWILRNGVGPLMTMDGGMNWVSQLVPVQNAALDDMQILDPQNGYIAGNYQVVHSSNGGKNWRNLGKFNSIVRGVYFPVPDEGWAVGTGGFIAHFHKVEP